MIESESPPGLNLDALTGWFDTSVPGRNGALSAELLAGGRSNLTYRVTDGDSSWVLRRPPLGHVLPSAHDMGREYRLISALAPTPVPVPSPIAFCDHDDIIGAKFYVMGFIDGIAFNESEIPADLKPPQLADLYTVLIDVLVRLHQVNPHTVGLGNLGKPDGYLERQIKRWRGQWEASETRPLPDLWKLIEKLQKQLPWSQNPTIVHGDFRLGNVMLTPARDDIAAVVDWEMATVGDPLTDLGMAIAYLEFSGDDRVPPRELLTTRYAAARGLDLSEIGWYVALANFKLAVICEGIHHRYLAGQTVGEGFGHFGETVPVLISSALRALRESRN
jgi:aminoglycoside phosphotransferase (APT) family kinase protein